MTNTLFVYYNLSHKTSFDFKSIMGFLELSHSVYLLIITAHIIYCFGIICIVFNRRNFLITMLFIEVMYVGIFISFIAISIFLNDPLGQLYALALLVTAACESAIGLGILLVIFRYENSIEFQNFTVLRG